MPDDPEQHITGQLHPIIYFDAELLSALPLGRMGCDVCKDDAVYCEACTEIINKTLERRLQDDKG